MGKESQISNLESQIKLKVCGLTELPQIQDLISLKEVDFLGFIFYENSPRFVLNHLTLNEITRIPHVGKVGVFVNESVEKIIEISEKAGLNYIQLHSDEDETFILELSENLNKNCKIIKVIRIGNQTPEALQKTINRQPSIVKYLLFDTDSKAFGGTGKTFDWSILNQIKIPKPYFLSGGIAPENIANRHILKQKPFALDINSIFETAPGVKDLEKIKQLLIVNCD